MNAIRRTEVYAAQNRQPELTAKQRRRRDRKLRGEQTRIMLAALRQPPERTRT